MPKTIKKSAMGFLKRRESYLLKSEARNWRKASDLGDRMRLYSSSPKNKAAYDNAIKKADALSEKSLRVSTVIRTGRPMKKSRKKSGQDSYHLGQAGKSGGHAGYGM